MATLLSYARQSGCWDFFSQHNLLALLSCLQDSTNEVSLSGCKVACLSRKWAQRGRMVGFPSCPAPAASPSVLCPSFPPPLLSWQIRDLASELLVRYFPPTFPEPVALSLFQLAQDALRSPRVQEAEAGALLMKTVLQKYEFPAFPSPGWHGSPRDHIGSTSVSPEAALRTRGSEGLAVK